MTAALAHRILVSLTRELMADVPPEARAYLLRELASSMLALAGEQRSSASGMMQAVLEPDDSKKNGDT